MSAIRRTRSFSAADLDEVVEDRLRAREARSARRSRRRSSPGADCSAALASSARVRLEIEQPPVDLDVGGPLPDRLDRRAERLVVEDAAVDEPGPAGRELRELVDAEERGSSSLRSSGRSPSHCCQLLEAHRREDAGDARGRAGGEGERAVRVGAEVVAAVVAAVAEGEHVAVPHVVDRVRVGVRHLPLVAVEVGDRDEELEQVPVGHQRRQRRPARPRCVHVVERVVDPLRHQVAPEAAPASAPAWPPTRSSASAAGSWGAASSPSMSPRSNQRSRKPSSERLWASAFARQTPLIPPADVPATTSTTTRVRTLPASRSASSVQEPAVDALAELGASAAGVGRVEQRGRLDEAVELLRHPVHVDRQRRAAVADEREAELLHGATVGRLLCGDVGVRRVQRPAFCSTRKTGRSAGNLADRPPRVKRAGPVDSTGPVRRRVLRRGLDDDQRVPVGIAQPEHRRHRVAVPADLVVHVDTGGLQRGVVGIDVGGVEDDARLGAARLLALRRRREGDRRLACRRSRPRPSASLGPSGGRRPSRSRACRRRSRPRGRCPRR